MQERDLDARRSTQRLKQQIEPNTNVRIVAWRSDEVISSHQFGNFVSISRRRVATHRLSNARQAQTHTQTHPLFETMIHIQQIYVILGYFVYGRRWPVIVWVFWDKSTKRFGAAAAETEYRNVACIALRNNATSTHWHQQQWMSKCRERCIFLCSTFRIWTIQCVLGSLSRFKLRGLYPKSL